MNKNRLIKSALCLALAFAMTFTPLFSSYAIIASATGTGEEQATELENTDATNEADQDKTTLDPEVDSTKDQQTEDAKAEEKVVKEEKSDKAEKEAAKDEEKATKTEYVWKDDKVKVTATLADADAIPDDAKLVATAIDKESQDYNYKAYMDALNKDSKVKYDESNTLLYDIAFIKDGVELQPESGKVSVTFDFLDDQLKQSIGAKKAADVNVIHLPLIDKVKDQYDTTADAKDIKAKDINVEEVTKEDNDLKVSVKNEKVVFETKDFSVFAYTVDFEYNGYAFSMPGNGTIELSKLFVQLGIDKKVKDVENVTFSNPKLVEVKKNTFGNDWTLESKKAFKTEETLTVEMTDGTIVINVTDAQDALTVTTTLYDYDDTTKIGFPSDFGGNDHIYLVAWVSDNKSSVIGTVDGNTPWAVVALDGLKGSSSSYSVNIDSFNTEQWGGNNLNYGDLTDDQKSNLLVRIIHSNSNQAPSLGSLRNSYQYERTKYDELWNGGFDGYEMSKNQRTGLISEGNYEVNFLKGNTLEHDVVLKFDPAADKGPIPAGKYYVLLDATSSDGNNHYYYVVEAAADGSTDKVYIPMTNNWSSNQPFSNNWRSITASVITPKAGETITPGGNKPDNEKYTMSYMIGDYIYSYTGRTTETDTEEHIQRDEFVLELKKGNFDDAIGPYDVLGEGAEYGVVADTYIRKDHTETNFAVNHYTEDTAAGIDLKANKDDVEGASEAMPFYVGDYNKIVFTGNTTVNPDIYTPSERSETYVHKNNPDEATDNIHQNDQNSCVVTVIPTDEEDVNNYVAGLISKLTESSNTYKDKPSVKMSGRTVDTTSFPDNVTIYIDASDLNISQAGWTIKKLEGQSIVLNIPGETVNIAKQYVSVYTKDQNGNLVAKEEGLDANTGGNGGNAAHNAKVEEYILNHVTFNAYEATKVNFTDGPAGLFLAPNADVEELNGSGTGWVATGKSFIQTSSEWHFFRTQRRYNISGEVNVEKIFGGEETSWGNADTFDFSITAKGKMIDGSLVDDPATIKSMPMPLNTTISIGKNSLNNPASFGSITYKAAGVYVYEVREVIPKDSDKIPGVTYDDSVYTVKITVTLDGTQFNKDVEIKKGEGSYDAGGTAVFTNNKTEEEVEGSLTLEGQKTITNKPASMDLSGFKFTVKEGDDVVATGTSAADGKITFTTINYTEAGNHTYVVSEDADSKPGVTNTTETKTVKVTVTEKDGTLEVKATEDSPAAINAVNFENAYNASGSLTLSGNKTITNKPEGMDLSGFKFTVKEGNEVVARGTSAADGKITFTAINYTAAGDHTYVVSEDADSKPGVENTTTTKTVKVTVTDDGEGHLTAVAADDSPAAINAVNFTNEYKTSGSLTLSGNKTITNKPEGMDLSGFKFTVKEGNEVVARGTSAADGKITFTAINYTEAGNHTYVVSEDSDSKPGVTNTTATQTVKVKVTDEDGTLVVEASEDSPAEINAVNFENAYNATGSAKFSAKKAGNAKLGNRTFQFELLNDKDEVIQTSAAVKQGETANFEAIQYTLADKGDHAYKIREKLPAEATAENNYTVNGVTYDTTVKEYTVNVSDAGNGTLTVKYNESTEFATPEFSNDYNSKGEGEVKVKKTLNGREWKTGDSFEFTITPVGDAPAFSPNTVTVTKADESNGYIKSFGEVTFSAAGTYQWTVSEKHKGTTVDGVAYDSTDKTVTIVVKDDGNGNLVAETDSALVQTAEFTNTYSKSGEGEVKVQKNLIGRNWATDDSFEFTITPVGNAPAFTTDTVTITDATEGHTKSFGKVTFAEAGTYQWTVSETHKGDKINGVSYDSEDKTVTIKVVDDGKGGLIADDDSALVQTAAFTNNYSAEGEGEIKVKKELEGRVWTNNDEFTFTLTAGDNNAGVTTPEPATKSITITKSDEGQTKSFGKIKFAKAGTYNYVVKETKGSLGGVTYDETDHPVTIKVVDDGKGNLIAETDDSLIKTETISNTYEATGTANFSAKKAGNAKLGDRTFQFELLDKDNNVIETSSAVKQGETATFAAINYTLNNVGDHTYKIREKIPAEATAANNYTVNGVTYDTTVKEYTVKVADAGNGTLTVKYNESPEFATPEFRNDYNAKGEGEVKVKKILSGREWKTGDSFEFTITPVGDAPAFSPNTVTVTKADESNGYIKSFGEVTFSAAGTYQWTVSEKHKGTTVDGVAYDSTDKTVTIVVKDDGNGNLVAETDSALVQTAEFTNTYSKSGEGEVKVQKNLIGRNWATDDSFEFTITPVGNAPAFTTDTVTITDATEGHTKSFGKVTFAEVGTYQWTVSETHKGDKINGVSYDSEDKTVTIKVVDDGKGGLIADDDSALVQTAAFTNNYSAEGEGQIKVKKTLGGRDWTTNDSFEFTLTPGENNAGVDTPMPETEGVIDTIAAAFTGSQKVTITSADAADDYTKSFGTVKFTKAGTYNWTVVETHHGDTIDGVAYDEAESKTVTIVVKDNGKGGLVAEEGSNLIQTKEFTNTYSTEGKAELKATKVIDYWGGADSFTFKLTAGTNTAGDNVETPMPAGATDGVITKTVTKDPEVLTALFGEITYTAPGEYIYTIEEDVPDGAVNGVKDGITYDTVTHTVKVTANDDAKNGQMVMTIDYGSGYSPAATAEPLEISNTYDANGFITLDGTKTFEHGSFDKKVFTFSIYDKAAFEKVGADKDRSKITDDLKPVATATTKDLTVGEDGIARFNFKTPDGKNLSYTLADISEDKGGKLENGLLTKSFEYVVVEDIDTDKTVQKTIKVDGKDVVVYYDEEADIQYDGTIIPLTVNVTDNGDGTLDVVKSDPSVEFNFVNKKLYTKLKLTKDIDKLVAGDTEGELADVTFVFKVEYTDPILGSVNRNVSIKFDSNNVAAQTAEVDKIPIDANVKVTEVYAADYKCDGDPTKDATLSEVADTQTGLKFFTVEFSNKMQGLITGGGLINSMQGGTGEKDGDSYKYNYQLKNQTGDLPD